MIICSNCSEEMTCVKTGVLVLWGTNHARQGDEFECGKCHNRTIQANNASYHASTLSVEAAKVGGYLRRMD